MAAMETDEVSVVLSSTTTSGLTLSLHPLPILNISEHLTRLKLQTNSNTPFVLGALLGTQNGREVEIVNTFELATVNNNSTVDHAFLVSRRDQYKQVFPSLEFIGWYTVAPYPTGRHIALHEQFTGYCSTPLLLLLTPAANPDLIGITSQTLPIKAYEPSIEIKERTSRSVYLEVPYTVETGEAERIAVDWTSRGGGSGTASLESHLQNQRAAVKMLHERILLLVKYVTDVIAGQATKDHTTLRALTALIASLPATENKHFRQEFETEYEDVQLTAFLSALAKSANILNDLVDKHLVLTAKGDDRYRRRIGRQGTGEWGALH
ncbi:hypothetical protein AX16_005666 [Volvariella volvacea WC 439]|nr:hypothetical protein AX16_005666 [Volvariella volvacea WC 439]